MSETDSPASNPPQSIVPSFNRIPIHKTHSKGEIMKSKHLFLGCLAVLSLAASQAFAQEKSVVYPGVDLEPSGNPIFTDAWTCDPAPLVVGDRLYVYTGEDIYKDGEKLGLPGDYNIADWRVYSTDDMVHWRSHGVKLRPEDFPNGKKGIAWAAQCIQKGDKFYWYVTYNTPSGGQCIGVAIGDTPVGPFVPHPKPLVVDKDTPGRGWNDIDPTVLIDDDGTAWLAWGQNSYIAKLKDNMTEIDGEITDLKLQGYIEGPWLYKRNGLYYNIYAGFGGGGGECINYSTATNLRGPWTYRGQVTGSPRNSFTIHPGVVDFKGHTYLFYHNGMLNRDGQRGQSLRRSVCVDELFFNEDGTIKPVTQTREAIKEPVTQAKEDAAKPVASADGNYPGVDLEPKGNPIFTDAWTCDPAPLVVGDRLFVYTGEDIYKDGENIGLPGNYHIADWRVYSTTDMVHWRSHGVKLRPEDFPNGKKGIAWAAQCIKKGDKFYWYVTYNTPTGGQCVGVAIGDTPVGPFKPHPKPLVEDKDTPGRGWNDIDPTVLIDDDGTAWLAWGQNSYIAKLKDNMTEIDGEITDLKLQRYIEGPWLYKRNGLYYNIYAGSGGRGGECINYSTAENPRGPWTFRGQVTGAAENSFTIHPGVVDYKGHTYLFYHNGKLDRAGQRGQSLRRSVCVDELFFNEDGTIKPVTQTKEAIKEPLK